MGKYLDKTIDFGIDKFVEPIINHVHNHYKSCIVLAGLLTVVSFMGNDMIKSQRLANEVAIVADTNKDGTTLPKEWARVYHEFEIHYDVHTAQPWHDLTKKQMQEYLSKHK